MSERKTQFDFTPEVQASRASLGISVSHRRLCVLAEPQMYFARGERFVMDPYSREQFLVITDQYGRRLMGAARSIRPTNTHTGSQVVKLLFDEVGKLGLHAEIHSFGDDQVERRARAVREAVKLLLQMVSNSEIGYEFNGRREEIRQSSTPSS